MPSRISEVATAAIGVAPSAPASSAADDDNTSITLTFNGVSFRLTPADQSSSSSGITNNDDGDEANMISFLQGLTGSGSSAQLTLKNFTGTLQVELAATTTANSTSSATCSRSAAIATSSPITTTAGGASRVSPESTAANKASNSTGAAADEPSTILGHSHNNTADDDVKSPAHKTPQRATSTAGAPKSKTKQQGLLPFASAGTASSTAGAKKKTNNNKSAKNNDAKSAIAKARAGGGKSKVR